MVVVWPELRPVVLLALQADELPALRSPCHLPLGGFFLALDLRTGRNFPAFNRFSNKTLFFISVTPNKTASPTQQEER